MPTALDFSLCASVHALSGLVTWLLAGMRRHVVVTDDVEVLAGFLVVDLPGQCSDHIQELPREHRGVRPGGWATPLSYPGPFINHQVQFIRHKSWVRHGPRVPRRPREGLRRAAAPIERRDEGALGLRSVAALGAEPQACACLAAQTEVGDQLRPGPGQEVQVSGAACG